MATVYRSIGTASRNQLLARLPAADFQRIALHLTTIPLHARQLLHKQGDPMREVYFPNSGVVSLATVLDDGALIEAATVGDEGLVGIEALYTDDPTAPCESIVQIPTPHESAEMMRVVDFRREIDGHRGLRDLVTRYAQALHAQLVRLTACNARHDVNERCARWLLMAHDHMRGHDFHLSQEYLAVMLGVRRQSVSGVAATFQKAGFIRYSHGDMAILNRPGLEETACECYRAIRSAYEDL